MLSLLFLVVGVFSKRHHHNKLPRVLSPEWNTKNPMGNATEFEAIKREHEAMRKRLNYSSYDLNVRVTKGMYTRGYEKIRLSVITRDSAKPSGVSWDYSSQFTYKWQDNWIHTSVVDAVPGGSKSWTINGETVTVKMPAENKGQRGILFADPCFTGSSCCCKYAKERWIFNRHTDMLNTLADNGDMDWWMIGGDNFYDSSDYWSQQFFNALNTNAKATMSGMVLGNHDYWIYSAPSQGQDFDNLGIGMTQYYAQDTLAAVFNDPVPYDFSENPSGKQNASPPPFAAENGIFWYKIGNVGVLGYSGAYYWDTYEPYVDQMCQQFSNDDGVKFLIVVSHWDALTNGYGVQWEMDAPSFLKKMKAMGSCSSFKYRTKYVDGHDHTNKVYDDGFKIGANGYDSGGYWGAVGDLYLKTDDEGRLWAYYLEFSNGPNSEFDSLLDCIKKNHLDGCLTHSAVTLWFDSGPPVDPSCYEMYDHDCVLNGQHATCGDRINYLETAEGMTWEQAYAQVAQECGATCQCNIGPTHKPTTGPPTHWGSCDDMLKRQACDSDGCYTCGDRIDYLVTYEHKTEAQAYAQLAEEFPGTCQCDNPPTTK